MPWANHQENISDISIPYPLHTRLKNPKNPTEKLKTQDFCQLHNDPIYQGLIV